MVKKMAMALWSGINTIKLRVTHINMLNIKVIILMTNGTETELLHGINQERIT